MPNHNLAILNKRGENWERDESQRKFISLIRGGPGSRGTGTASSRTSGSRSATPTRPKRPTRTWMDPYKRHPPWCRWRWMHEIETTYHLTAARARQGGVWIYSYRILSSRFVVCCFFVCGYICVVRMVAVVPVPHVHVSSSCW